MHHFFFLCSWLGAYNVQNQILKEVIENYKEDAFIIKEMNFLLNNYWNNLVEEFKLSILRLDSIFWTT